MRQACSGDRVFARRRERIAHLAEKTGAFDLRRLAAETIG